MMSGRRSWSLFQYGDPTTERQAANGAKHAGKPHSGLTGVANAPIVSRKQWAQLFCIETLDMSIIKIIELVGESPHSWEDAMREVIAEAQKTLRGITRIGVKEFDVRLRDDKIHLFRVRAEVSFRLER